ncbi:rhomboid family protein [Niveomyces insectorum RCEF 264]|uniref:Rhomboid family protein n=1 Tax=Niveomyces insectorum RCEF 264 TaxID=1081102 RepID=A0A167Z733_9HYPO|nr:rhomboid family protein [Niveomyces insectorum RCEF 264]
MPPRLNIPPVTRIVLIALVLQSVLSAAIRYRQWTAQLRIVIPYLNLIPQLSILYPWTFVTTTLVESNVFTLGIACVTLYQGGRYLERAWSSREFAKFLLVASLLPNVLTLAVLLVAFSLTHDENWTLISIAGTIPLQIAFLVAFSQLVPAHTVTLFRGLLSLRVPRFPVLYLLAVSALALTPLLTVASPLLAVFGFLVSWTYLRFYKSVFPDLDSASQMPALRGDASETFALAEFFPGPVKPLVAAVSDAVFNVLVAVRLCTPFTAADLSARAAAAAAAAGAALDQRLHAAAASAATRGGSGAYPTGVYAATATAPSSASQPPAQPPQQQPSPPPAASDAALPAAATGPTVQTQPRANAQTGMTAPGSTNQSAAPLGGLLGETSYVPDHDGERSSA